MKKKTTKKENDLIGVKASPQEVAIYGNILNGVVELLESARRTSARATNAIMTATYWEVGRRIFEFEQGKAGRAEYGKQVIATLSSDLSTRFGRGFSVRNLEQMRKFHRAWPIAQTVSAQLGVGQISARFPLPWSHYVLLLKVDNANARQFYETEALRGGWSVRQLDRQISTLFFERTLASKNKKAMLEKGSVPESGDLLTAEQEIKDPLVLEFLGLKDEYSETDLENALIEHLETFLLELGGDFTFVGRQRRLRIDDEWYRIDLLFFHRVLRCLVVIDLKLGKFTHADAGQMMLYLGYAAEHWTRPGENPPVGLVLCSQQNRAVAHYTIDRLNDKVLAAEYRLALPDEKTLEAEVERTQAAIERRTPVVGSNRVPPVAKKTRRKGAGK